MFAVVMLHLRDIMSIMLWRRASHLCVHGVLCVLCLHIEWLLCVWLFRRTCPLGHFWTVNNIILHKGLKQNNHNNPLILCTLWFELGTEEVYLIIATVCLTEATTEWDGRSNIGRQGGRTEGLCETQDIWLCLMSSILFSSLLPSSFSVGWGVLVAILKGLFFFPSLIQHLCSHSPPLHKSS